MEGLGIKNLLSQKNHRYRFCTLRPDVVYCWVDKKLWETQTNEKYDHPRRTRPDQAPPLAQTLGLLITVLVLIGFITVLRAGVGLVANLFDDTAQKQEYEDKLEGLVLFDPMPFDGIENIDDLTAGGSCVGLCVQHSGDAGRL